MFDNFEFKPLYSKKEVAALLGVSERFLEGMVQRGEFPKPIPLDGVRSNGRAKHLRFFGEEVRAYLNSRAQIDRVDCRILRAGSKSESVVSCQ